MRLLTTSWLRMNYLNFCAYFTISANFETYYVLKYFYLSHCADIHIGQNGQKMNATVAR